MVESSVELRLMDIDKLRAAFRYEPDNGRLISKRNGREITGPRRQITKAEYETVHFQGKYLRAARIIWALYTGEWPAPHLVIDHKNGDTHDNRIRNLRLITRAQNLANDKYTQTGFRSLETLDI